MEVLGEGLGGRPGEREEGRDSLRRGSQTGWCDAEERAEEGSRVQGAGG